MSGAISLTPRSGELYSHTAIRGIAALCVVGCHAVVGAAGQGYTDNQIQNFFVTSFLFVDFFFILSGFIMFENYGQKIGGPAFFANSVQYWKKRLLKILPNYYLWLIIAVAITYLKWNYFGDRVEYSECVEDSVVKHFLLVQNLIGSCHYFNIALWSIAVEIIAYLAFPIIILLRTGWFSTLLIGAIFYFIFFSFSGTIDIIDGYFSILRCLAGFICGIAAAKMNTRNWWDVAHVTIIALLVCAISLNYQIISLLLMFIITVATAQNTGIVSKISQMKLPYVIGRSSFSIYLAHVPVAMVVNPIAFKFESATGLPIGSDWRVIMPLEVVASCAVGILAYVIVERRFERLFAKQARVQIA